MIHKKRIYILCLGLLLIGFTASAEELRPDGEDFQPAFLEYLSSVEASSELGMSGGQNFTASNLIQCNFHSWSEGVDGPGIGESIRYTFNQPVSIKTLGVVNGCGDLKFFHKNNRVKTLVVTNENGESRTINLRDTFAVQNCSMEELDGAVFDFTIQEVYPGTQFDDTCLTALIPGGLANDNFTYSVDFRSLLVPQNYLKSNAWVAEWKAAMGDFDREHADEYGLNGSVIHYDEFLHEYPRFASSFPYYDEMPESDYDISGYFDGLGFLYTVLLGGYHGDGQDLCSKCLFLLTDNDDSLVVCVGRSLSFKLNGESVPAARFIDLPSQKDIFGDNPSQTLTEAFDYSGGELTIYYFNQDYFSYPYENYRPLKSVNYRWNGEKFIR